MDTVNPAASSTQRTATSATQATGSKAAVKSNPSTVDYQAFLRLLVTQLKNQDPTSPTDNAQLMAQLASFSSVEQQAQTNTRLDQLIKTNLLGDATGLIGKTITSSDGKTSGVVKSVTLAKDGISAELQNGSKMAVGTGTKITNPGLTKQVGATSSLI